MSGWWNWFQNTLKKYRLSEHKKARLTLDLVASEFNELYPLVLKKYIKINKIKSMNIKYDLGCHKNL